MCFQGFKLMLEVVFKWEEHGEMSSGVGSTEELVASCDEQVKWGENNTLVMKDNLPHCNFSEGQKFKKLYLKQMKK